MAELSPKQIREFMGLAHEFLVDAGRTPSCLNCIFFNHKLETCDQAQGQRPPARTIVFGCPRWEMDIPF